MQLRNASMPVLVLPMDHYGSLGVMRSLGRLGVPVYGAHPTPRPIASFSTWMVLRAMRQLGCGGLPGNAASANLVSFGVKTAGRT